MTGDSDKKLRYN